MEQWDAIFPAILPLFLRPSFVVVSLTPVRAFTRFPM
jgi:hypothetical protein